MKKILYVTTIDLTMNTFLIPHIKKLIEEGFKVDCACNIQLELDKTLISMGVNTYHIDFSRNPLNLSNLKAIKQIKELQNKNQYDIVHVHTPVASFVTRFALKNENIKMIYTTHGFHFYEGAPKINWLVYYNLEKISAKWTDRIITINSEDFEAAKKFKLRSESDVKLMHGVGIDEKEYVLDNFDRDKYRKTLNINEGDFVILILAELNKNKNHMQIIKAIELLDESEKKNIKVICAGKGPLKDELEKITKEKNLDSIFNFIGFRKDVKELLSCSDCVALFSYREGLGKCLLEGMINKKPIIATKSRGAKELIIHKKNGFLVENNDYKITIKYIKQLMENKNLSKSLGLNSEVIIENYYKNNILKQIKSFNE